MEYQTVVSTGLEARACTCRPRIAVRLYLANQLHPLVRRCLVLLAYKCRRTRALEFRWH
jgi:hypothetical protein